ncbi:MAG: hypothetical protein LC115_07455 [Bacteroidia bacterium]|nr:hypothetical protein [Bacteroidia bacterium]
MKLKPTIFQISVIILLAAFARLIPHPPNFTPIGAMALLGGMFLSGTVLPIVIPLAAVFLSDLWIGFHETMLFVYIGVVLTTFIGKWIASITWKKTILASLLASIVFFILTNLGVWLTTGMYAPNLSGLFMCYAAAIPFFHYSLLGDLFFVSLLSGLIIFIASFQRQPSKAV